jgi:hypothetical protein
MTLSSPTFQRLLSKRHTGKEKKKKKTSHNFLLNTNSVLKTLCTWLMRERKIPWLPGREVAVPPKARSACPCGERHGAGSTGGGFFCLVLTSGLGYGCAPHPPRCASRCALGSLLAAAPGGCCALPAPRPAHARSRRLPRGLLGQWRRLGGR